MLQFILFFYKLYSSMRKILLLAVVVLVMTANTCPTNYQISNLQAGSSTFEATQKSSQIVTTTYDHLFKVSFASQPTVAYSIHNIVINVPLAYQWSISTHSITNNKLTIRFKYQPLQWTLIKCGFLAGSRKDIILGTITSNFESLKQNSAIISVELNEPIPNHTSSILRVFISGFTMKSGSEYFIRAFDKSIGQRKAQLGIQVAGTMQITQIQLNYIIFSPRLLPFASYGGGNNQIQINESKIYNIERNIYDSDYRLFGIGHMRHSGNNPIAFLCQIDNKFYLRVDSLRPFQQIYIAYIVLGVTPVQLCQHCNTSTSISDRQCVSECPINSYPVRYQDGAKACRTCPIQYNMVLNSTKNGCQCMNGYVRKRGFCVDANTVSNISPITPLIQKILNIINQTQTSTSMSSFGTSDNFQSSIIQNQQTVKPPTNMNIGQVGSITKSLHNSQVLSGQNVINTAQVAAVPIRPITTNKNTNTNNLVKLPENIDIPGKYRIVGTPSTIPAGIPSSNIRTIQQNSYQPNNNIQQPNRVVSYNTPVNTNQQMNIAYYGTNYASSTQSIQHNNSKSSIQAVVSVSEANSRPNYVSQYGKPSIVVTNMAPTPTVLTSNSSPISISNRNQNIYSTNNHIQNSYIPSTPIQQTRTISQQYPVNSGPAAQVQLEHNPGYVSKDCSQYANTYWTGYRCACKVGYSSIGSVCTSTVRSSNSYNIRPAQFIKRLSALILSSHTVHKQTHSKHEKQYKYDEHKQQDIICMDNSRLQDGQCVCLQGFQSINEQCRRKQEHIQCGLHQYRNSFGHCVCVGGYVLQGGRCIRQRNKCGANSYQDPSGNCQCNKGYNLYGKLCLYCPPGQVSVGGTCQHVCGMNQISKILQKNINECICHENYGRIHGVCQQCPDDYFNINGYCVACPVRTIYNPHINRCTCAKGYVLRNGICQKLCNDLFQQYSEQTDKCRCLKGFGRIANRCTQCISGVVDPFTQQCINNCKNNQIRVGNRCICKPQYGYGHNQECIRCIDIAGGYLIDGICAKCPQNQIYVDRKCSCPKDKKLIHNKCVSTCNSPTQLIDSNGFCYYCPINEEIVNNKCVCKSGYERINNVCLIKCPLDFVQINGICGFCAMNTKYCPIRKACLCPDGHYMNKQGVCEMNIPSFMQCAQGSYYSIDSKICKPCGKGCKSCKKFQTCQKCIEQGYQPSGSVCMPKCGDGIKLQNQPCDDGNNNNFDGCSQNCQIETYYSCQGTRPSICTKTFCGDGIVTHGQQCDDRNFNRGDGCFNCLVQQGWQCPFNKCLRITRQQIQNPIKPPQQSVVAPNTGTNLQQVGQAMINVSNIIIVLQCPTAFKFQSDGQMRSFMKYRFNDKSTEPRSAYCVQRSKTPKLFDCLNIYPTGVPVKQFDITYYYSYEGQAGETIVHVDTLKKSQIKMSRTFK